MAMTHQVSQSQKRHAVRIEVGGELRGRARFPAGERALGGARRAVGQRAARTEIAFDRWGRAARDTSRERLIVRPRLGALHLRDGRLHLFRDVSAKREFICSNERK